MYSKHGASQLRQQFWTALGQYMSPVPSSEGEMISWINYKTGVKHMSIKMSVNGQVAEISLILYHPPLQDQKDVFDQLHSFKKLLNTPSGPSWCWQLHSADDNDKIISKISSTLIGLQVFNRNDWPGLISFFKDRLIALDAFWNPLKPAFE